MISIGQFFMLAFTILVSYSAEAIARVHQLIGKGMQQTLDSQLSTV
jgi:hypothetical protein